jgi:hypothetical protein
VHPAFGEKVPVSNPIREALLRAPALRASDVMLMLRERYETTYGIFNHDMPLAEPRPLAVVAMHPKEDVLVGSLLYERLDQFIDKDVFKYTGLAWDRFLELPHYQCERILELCHKRKEDHRKSMNGIADQLEAQLNDSQ